MDKKNKYKLNKLLDNTNPFSVPKGYFDSFSERILQQVNQNEIKQKPKFNVINLLKPSLALIASFIVIFLAIYIPVKIINPMQAEKTIEKNNQQLEYMNYYYINDHVIVKTFEEENEEDYDDMLLETVLLASISDIELLDYQH